MKGHWSRVVAGATVLLLSSLTGAHAQLDQQFTQIFNTILKDRLILSPGPHKGHYFEAAASAESLLTPSLNSLIVSNISSFPLTSTTPGVSFSFSGGELVSSTEGLGPVFADRATTVGRGKFSFGLNATYLDLSRFRGLATDQMQFAFTHKDLNGDGILGGLDSTATEADVIDVTLGTHITASIFVFYATYGITSNLDLGIAVPLIHISVNGTAHAVISSYTYANQGFAEHVFGGTATRPILTTDVPYDQSVTGLGDLAVRLKYCFLRGGSVDLGALVDARIPTGKKEDFLGTGKADVTIAGLLSKKIGDFAPHFNVGYEIRSAEFQSSRVVVKGGFDQKLLAGMTFAADFLGTFDTDQSKAIKLFPGSATIREFAGPGQFTDVTVPLSNIPDRNNDNLYNLSVGFRFAPSTSVLFLANILVPLNDGGLRAPIAPTVGFSMNL